MESKFEQLRSYIKKLEKDPSSLRRLLVEAMWNGNPRAITKFTDAGDDFCALEYTDNVNGPHEYLINYALLNLRITEVVLSESTEHKYVEFVDRHH